MSHPLVKENDMPNCKTIATTPWWILVLALVGSLALIRQSPGIAKAAAEVTAGATSSK